LSIIHGSSLDVGTPKGLFVQMDRLDVPLQSFLLSELFPTVLATSLLLLFVHGHMSAQPRGGMEAFTTLLLRSSSDIVNLVGTNVRTLIVVLGFDVGLEMLVPQETFVTPFFVTWEWTLIGVRANVHLQANGAVERFAAIFVSA
jgi:hypothetical protein